jgi:hypothetical protein
MLSLICIENATGMDYILSDQSDRRYSTIKANSYQYIRLPYDNTKEVKYTFKNDSSFYMTLSVIGEILRIYPNSQVHLEIKDSSQHPPDAINPVCAKPKSAHYNKLLITPINDVYARANVPVTHLLYDLSYGT